MGGNTKEWKLFYRKQERVANYRKSPEAQRLVAEFERSHEALVEQYNTVIWLCSRMLVAEARTLNDLDHLLAEKKGLPPPEPIEKEGFYGRRCASIYREYSVELSFRTRRYRDPLSDGRWRTKFFDTPAEAVEFEQQLVVQKAQRRAEKKRKSQERLKRWVQERLQVSYYERTESILSP